MPGIIALIRRSLAIYRSHGSFFAGYAAWILLPYAGLILAEMLPTKSLAAFTTFAMGVAMILLWVWVMTVMTRAARDIASGKPIHPPEHIASSTRLFRSVIFANILYSLITLGGFILLVVPGLVFTVWYALTGHAAMLDEKRGAEALTASRELSRGRFWIVAWKFFGGPLLISVAYYVPLSVVLLTIAAITGTPFEAFVSDNPPLWSDVLVTVTDVFMLPVTVIYLTLVYLELKQNYVRTDHRTGNSRPA